MRVPILYHEWRVSSERLSKSVADVDGRIVAGIFPRLEGSWLWWHSLKTPWGLLPNGVISWSISAIIVIVCHLRCLLFCLLHVTQLMVFASPVGPHPYFPFCQRSSHDHLLHPGYHPQVLGLRGDWTPQCCRDSGAWIRSDLWPELLSPESQCDGRTSDGTERLMGAEEVRPSRSTADGWEGPQDVLSARWKSVADLFVHRLRVRRGLERMEGDCQFARVCSLRDGGSGVQGQMECGHVSGHLECFQFVGQQFLDGKPAVAWC